jgi:hypothetical protein
VLHDGEQVTLGGVTLTAHLTAGHTRGCTTGQDGTGGGRTPQRDVRVQRPPAVLTPAIIDESPARSRQRALPCDVQLGDHGAQYNMREKYAKLKDAVRIRSSTEAVARSRRTFRGRSPSWPSSSKPLVPRRGVSPGTSGTTVPPALFGRACRVRSWATMC